MQVCSLKNVPHCNRCPLQVDGGVPNDQIDIKNDHRENENCNTLPAANSNHGKWQQLHNQRDRRFPQTKQNPSHQNSALSPCTKWTSLENRTNIQGGIEYEQSVETQVS